MAISNVLRACAQDFLRSQMRQGAQDGHNSLKGTWNMSLASAFQVTLRDALMLRTTASESVASSAAFLYPTAAEDCLVSTSAWLHEALLSSGIAAECSPLPLPTALYHEFVMLRHRRSLLNPNRRTWGQKIATQWTKAVKTEAGGISVLKDPWETSPLAPLLTIPAEGHAALGELLIDVMRFLDEVGSIKCWTSAGTLLGMRRSTFCTASGSSGSFIPWDDDTDVCIGKRDEDKLRTLFERLGADVPLFPNAGAVGQQRVVPYLNRELVLEHVPLFGYKMYDRRVGLPMASKEIMERGGVMTFGCFVDLFVVDDVVTDSNGLHPLLRAEARKTWPHEAFCANKLFPLQLLPFRLATRNEPVRLAAPMDVDDYLDRLYGVEWRHTAIIPRQIHYGVELPSELVIRRANFLQMEY